MYQLIDRPIYEKLKFHIAEINLYYLPELNFKIDQWNIFDGYTQFASDTIVKTVQNLILHDIVELEIKKQPIKILGFHFYTSTSYFIHIKNELKPSHELGWIEERLIHEIKTHESGEAESIFYRLFNYIFKTKDNFINPGKMFVKAILENQRLNLYHIEVIKGKLSPICSSGLDIKPIGIQAAAYSNVILILEKQIASVPFLVENKNLLNKIISSQLIKFHKINND